MPYVKPPQHQSPESAVYDLPPLKLRPKHRRTRSATSFSDERGPGAFVSLSNLPRHKLHNGERRTVFHFNEQDSDSSDETLPSDAVNALRLTVDTKNLPSNVPVIPPQREDTSFLPFPCRGSPAHSPLPPSPSTASPLPRTPSNPIILSNGKPLKPSLKSSLSSPNVPSLRLHTRAQSEPATPSGGPVKNVHFAGDDALRSVKVFNSSGKPVNVSRLTNADETETETEYDSSNPAPEQNGYPFPTSVSATEDVVFELDANSTSPVPAVNPPMYANVHVEALLLPRMSPPMLRGSILVRNLTFTKDVAVRFTLDDWHTTSEVVCKHVACLPSLPPPFPSPSTHGDQAVASAPGNTWDRFSFVIRLEDFERKLHEKTMWMVVRYTAAGIGEWWDNNNGQDYRVGFLKAGVKGMSALVSHSSRLSPVMGNSQQRTFSAPPTLKGTPTTEAVSTVAHGTQVPSARFSLPPAHFRQHRASMPSRPSPPIRHNSSPQASLSSMGAGSPAAAALCASAPSKLNLLNYAAPSHSPSLRHSSHGAHFVGLSDASPAPVPTKHMNIVGGMPATTPQSDLSWPPSNSSSQQSLSDTTPPPMYTALPVPSESEKQRAKEIVSSPSSSLAHDTSYAAFVKQWCFVQSPTPSPTVTPSSSNGNLSWEAPQTSGNAWRGLGMLYGSGVRSDSPMLASM